MEDERLAVTEALISPLRIDGLTNAAAKGNATAHFALALIHADDDIDDVETGSDYWYQQAQSGRVLAGVEKEWAYILNDCGAEVCFVPSEKIKDRVLKVRGDCPALQHVVTFTGSETESDTMAALLRRGAETPAPLVKPDKSDLAGLIYTSGTTGKPKGVKLSHSNMANNVSAMHEMLAIGPGDRSLSFLPWAHSFGQVVELHGLFSMCASRAIADSV